MQADHQMSGDANGPLRRIPRKYLQPFQFHPFDDLSRDSQAYPGTVLVVGMHAERLFDLAGTSAGMAVLDLQLATFARSVFLLRQLERRTAARLR